MRIIFIWKCKGGDQAQLRQRSVCVWGVCVCVCGGGALLPFQYMKSEREVLHSQLTLHLCALWGTGCRRPSQRALTLPGDANVTLAAMDAELLGPWLSESSLISWFISSLAKHFWARRGDLGAGIVLSCQCQTKEKNTWLLMLTKAALFKLAHVLLGFLGCFFCPPNGRTHWCRPEGHGFACV